MAIIEFSREEKAQIIPLIQKYLQEELDTEAGSFDAEFLLDFFAEEIGGFMYNRALADVQKILSQRMENITDDIYALEKPVGFEKK